MKPAAALVAATLLIAVILFHRAEANPISRSCEGANCVVDLTRCEYGEVTDFFGRKVCAKGPGERCSDYESCGDGLSCAQKLCVGCSLATLQCFSIVSLPLSEEE
ncbi:neuroparsin-A isoform X2 [Schistocerca americana]|uniref:neuroparsin-A isoform X2 n=1 Tax=Schistocerca americana TaxID=7009 RepID=UPI001F5010D8|nr:neuroparsin-A isoform X2 [Schistocerca americana]XP_049960104.1 neuroparsin-A isoform X2 [Schistocerca serialis cubense]